MIKLYYAPWTRSTRVRWLLEELEAPYELVRLDLSQGEHKNPSYMKVHPLGVVPALQDGNHTLLESGAICAYLTDKFPEKRLAPPLATIERGYYYQWLFFAVATLETPLVTYFLHTTRLPEEQRKKNLAEQCRKQFFEGAQVVDRALGNNTYMVGDSFTTADIFLASLMGWSDKMGLLAEFPKLKSYAEQHLSRPAHRKATAD